MHGALRFGAGWLLAAVVAVGLSWAVISDAVDPGWLGHGSSRSGVGRAGSDGGIGAAAGIGDPENGASPSAVISATFTSSAALATGDPAPTGTPHRTGQTGAASSRPGTGRTGTGPTGGPGQTGTTATGGGQEAVSGPGATGPEPTETQPTVPITAVGAGITTPPPGVRGYQVNGGQVVLRVGSSSASLISATPAAGYRVQTWEEVGWLRVDFSSGNATSSLFATWNGHPPSVQTAEY